MSFGSGGNYEAGYGIINAPNRIRLEFIFIKRILFIFAEFSILGKYLSSIPRIQSLFLIERRDDRGSANVP
jgi:hypothetical protein